MKRRIIPLTQTQTQTEPGQTTNEIFLPIQSRQQLLSASICLNSGTEAAIKQITRIKKISDWQRFGCTDFKDYCTKHLPRHKYDTLLAWANAGIVTMALDSWANVGKYSICSMRALHALDPFRRKRVWHALLTACPGLKRQPHRLTRQMVEDVVTQLYPVREPALTTRQLKRKAHNDLLIKHLKTCQYKKTYDAELADILHQQLPATVFQKLQRRLSGYVRP